MWSKSPKAKESSKPKVGSSNESVQSGGSSGSNGNGKHSSNKTPTYYTVSVIEHRPMHHSGGSSSGPTSYRTLGIFEDKNDIALSLPKFKSQIGVGFPSQHADPGTLKRRHKISIKTDYRNDPPDNGVILELEYGGGSDDYDQQDYYATEQHNYKRRDIVFVSKIPFYKHVEIDEEDRNMRDINIIDLRK